jgi:hypothetical protein
MEVWERTPSMLRNIDDRSSGGAGTGGPERPTINAKKR